MSYRLQHEYTSSRHLVGGTVIATCRACGVLRSATADGAIVWIRPGDRSDDRVQRTEPVCIDPPNKPRARPWGDGRADARADLERERRRDDDGEGW